ncbi:hypothetical protein BN946_scf184911.g91 [Trametes cinnabarina]|uniref:Cupin 2 conserved barrel domain-containing protein n=1 Tax=Pycnoporus cinnabarinus TaxID=5643 RepID=A0A060SBK3_PYCCI|nr:hypothetical protein BN946_scf184911.g91 [Trametes cinnabarina]
MASSTESTGVLPGVRRVVTGHRVDDGLAIVKSDELMPSREAKQGHPDIRVGALWATDSIPHRNATRTDGATRKPDGDFGIVKKSGTNLQYTDLAPGATVAAHRTSSLDHNVLSEQHIVFQSGCALIIDTVVSGKLVLIMEDGSETLLDKPGDLVVQRGTIHAWRNPGADWARWITFVIDAKPAVVNGKALEATSQL